MSNCTVLPETYPKRQADGPHVWHAAAAGWFQRGWLCYLQHNSNSCCLLQVSVLKQMAFVRKQHAIRDAVQIGDQIIRRSRRMLLASTFNAWKLRAGIYRQVARRFQASLEVTLRWAWGQWRAQLATQVRAGHVYGSSHHTLSPIK